MSEDTIRAKLNQKLQIASYKALQLITLRKQGQYLQYASAALAIAAMGQADLPAALAAIGSTIGVEALGNLLGKLADGEDLPPEAIIDAVERAVSESGLQELLLSNQGLAEQITQLTSWQEQIETVLDQDQEMATNLIAQYQTLSADVSGIRQKMEKLATRKQSQKMQKTLDKIWGVLEEQKKNELSSIQSVSKSNAFPNPFGLMGCIEDPNYYLVRQPFTQDVLTELNKGVNLSIVGDSQTGKSSLLWHIQQNGPEFLPEFTDFVYVGLELIHSEDDFFEFICGELGVPVQRGFRLARVLKGRRVLLCLDEFEKMTWEGFTLHVRTELRGLADGNNAPFRLLLASRTPLDKLFANSSNMTSPLAGICLKLTMTNFTLTETDALAQQYLAGSQLAFPRLELETAWQQSNGHPSRLQQALKEVFSRLFD